MEIVESCSKKSVRLEDGGDACGSQYKRQHVSCNLDLIKGNVTLGGLLEHVPMLLSTGLEKMESLLYLGIKECSKTTNELKSMELLGNDIGLESVDVKEGTSCNDVLDSSKALIQPWQTISVDEVSAECTQNGHLTVRRVSAVRDFPYGCGRNAPPLSREEVEKIRAEALLRTASTGNTKVTNVKVVKKVRSVRGCKIRFLSNLMKKDAGGGDSLAKKNSLTGQASPQLGNKENVMYQEGSCSLMAKSSSQHDRANIAGSKDGFPSLMVKSVSQHLNTGIVRHKRGDLSPVGKVFHQYKNQGSVKYEESPCKKIGKYRKLAVNDKAQDEQGVTREKVRECLRLFQVICRKFLQDDREKSKYLGKRNRADLKAFTLLKERGMVARKRYLGGVPGVEVGDEFHYRVELAITGLHYPPMAGIDFMDCNGKKITTCIVSSGGYTDVMDSNDVLIYSGEGGHPGFERRRIKPLGDQKLERGNLALKNSMDEKIPVRVIHGFKQASMDSSTKKIVTTYVYDGLYFVEKYWSEMGPMGFNIFKFRLRRKAGQPELALKEVRKARRMKMHHGLCVEDISQGKEGKPISAVNVIDGEPPLPFKYTTEMIYPLCYKHSPPQGCDCIGGCIDSEKCACAAKNGGVFPFYYGAVVRAKPLIYECGPSCKCPPSCYNRVSQHGIKFQLEIFKTRSRGWGVRSLSSIASGSFICEYTGEVLEDSDAEKRTNDEYLFGIGKSYDVESLWDHLSSLLPDLQKSTPEDDTGFAVDAARYGNVGRFINHSCSPNLYAQNVLYDHDNKRMPHIMLFAAENIAPLKELTYHYNYKIGQVYDLDGNLKEKKCCCGSDVCCGRLY